MDQFIQKWPDLSLCSRVIKELIVPIVVITEWQKPVVAAVWRMLAEHRNGCKNSFRIVRLRIWLEQILADMVFNQLPLNYCTNSVLMNSWSSFLAKWEITINLFLKIELVLNLQPSFGQVLDVSSCGLQYSVYPGLWQLTSPNFL